MLSPRTVLIADDDRALRESLGEALADLGYQTRIAASGSQALEALTTNRCDLLLSDVDMPDMTGFQLLSWVNQHPPRLPVVLMSARADAHLLARAKADGAYTLLSKPVRITELTALVHHLVSEGNHHG